MGGLMGLLPADLPDRYAISKAKHTILFLSVMQSYFAVFGLMNAHSAFRTANC
jgi:hypothetical protein